MKVTTTEQIIRIKGNLSIESYHLWQYEEGPAMGVIWIISSSNTNQMSSGMISPTMSTHNSTSFICNICLEPPAPTQTQHAGNRPCSTHNQPLQHNSALVLLLSLHPPSPVPSLKLLSDGSTHWPLAGHPLLVDGRLDQDLGEPRFPFTYRDCGPAALTYLLVWCAFKWGQLAALRGPSSCYHGPVLCLWPAEKSPQHLLVVFLSIYTIN